MSKNVKNKQNIGNDTIHSVSHSCYDCTHLMSAEYDLICHIWCDKKDRDFTFDDKKTEICEFFEKD